MFARQRPAGSLSSKKSATSPWSRPPFFRNLHPFFWVGKAAPFLNFRRNRPHLKIPTASVYAIIIHKVEYDRGHPHGGVRPFHQKSTCLAQLTLGPYAVQIWTRYGRNFDATKPACSIVRIQSVLELRPSQVPPRICRANSAQIRQSRPDSGLVFQVKALKPF